MKTQKISQIPKYPAHFSAKARALWTSIHGEYELADEAAETLRIALENMDLGDRARELLRTEGLVMGGKKHPASDAAKLHDGMFARYMRALALDVVQPHSGIQAGKRVA